MNISCIHESVTVPSCSILKPIRVLRPKQLDCKISQNFKKSEFVYLYKVIIPYYLYSLLLCATHDWPRLSIYVRSTMASMGLLVLTSSIILVLYSLKCSMKLILNSTDPSSSVPPIPAFPLSASFPPPQASSNWLAIDWWTSLFPTPTTMEKWYQLLCLRNATTDWVTEDGFGMVRNRVGYRPLSDTLRLEHFYKQQKIKITIYFP